MTEILRFKDFLTENHKKEICDFLSVIGDTIHINIEHMCHHLGLTYVNDELALNQNPDIENSDFDFEDSVEIAEDLDSVDRDELMTKIDVIKQKLSGYIQDIILNFDDNLLYVTFVKNVKVEVI